MGIINSLTASNKYLHDGKYARNPTFRGVSLLPCLQLMSSPRAKRSPREGHGIQKGERSKLSALPTFDRFSGVFCSPLLFPNRE